MITVSTAYLHNQLISEGSCDTEDWRNDAEKISSDITAKK